MARASRAVSSDAEPAPQLQKRSKTMKSLKLGLLATVAGVLLSVSGGLIHTRGASAQVFGPEPGVASVACAAAQGNWTDCTVTLTQSVPAGGSIAASLGSNEASIVYCTDGSRTDVEDYRGCGINGNAAVFTFPQGGVPGQQVFLSALGASDAALAQVLTVSAGGRFTQTPSTNQLLLVAPDARPTVE
jgi:hypothetical protein